LRVDLTFIMPVYNEINQIETAYKDVINSLKVRKETTEIIFIDNGSIDGTKDWLRKIEDPAVKVIFNDINLGKGGSIRKGIEASRSKYIVIYDPDYEYRAEGVWKCYDSAVESNASLVLGSRVLKSKVRYLYYINYFGVRLLTFIINILYEQQLTDTATAIKLFKSSAVNNINLRCSGFALDFELVTRIARLKKKIIETPVEYFPRTVEDGKKIKPFKDGILALRVILIDRLIPIESIVKVNKNDL
jgi:dolichol-phosphate mannosyltransferase